MIGVHARRHMQGLRTLVTAAACLLAAWWLADLLGLAWPSDPDAQLAALIATSVPALALALLLDRLSEPAPGPPPMAATASKPRPMRLSRRRQRRQPRIARPVACSHCGQLPGQRRRAPRIVTSPPPRRSLAALIAASTPGRPRYEPRRPPRIVGRH